MKRCLLASVVGLAVVGCLEQYNPRPIWRKLEQERQLAHRDLPRLNDDGTLPALNQSGVDQPARPAQQLYANFCAPCHGASGHGDGPTGRGLSPQPRDFTDTAWQAASDDARIDQVIRKGGAAVGLSTLMLAFGSQFTDEEIKGLVTFIRAFDSGQ